MGRERLPARMEANMKCQFYYEFFRQEMALTLGRHASPRYWTTLVLGKHALQTKPNPSLFTSLGLKLRLGDEVRAPADVLRSIRIADLYEALNRHERFDFGEEHPGDWEAAMQEVGLVHLGVYVDRNGVKFWVR